MLQKNWLAKFNGRNDKMSLTLTEFDPAAYLTEDESICAFLTDALEEDDPAVVLDALDTMVDAMRRHDLIAPGKIVT